MRRVRGIDDVGRMDVARIFLADALEQSFGTGTFNPHRDAGVFRLESLGDALGDRQVDRGIVDDLAFLFGGFDQGSRDRDGLGRSCPRRRGKDDGGGAGCLEHRAS
jgi:hypothetical protein